MKIDGTTRVVFIIGNLVSHSLSPAMLNTAFAALGINSVYLPFQVKNGAGALDCLCHLNVGGASVIQSRIKKLVLSPLKLRHALMLLWI